MDLLLRCRPERWGPTVLRTLGLVRRTEEPQEASRLFFIGTSSSLQADLALCLSPEKIDVVPVEPHTVLLGIHGGKLCLACVKAGDEIRLQLEVSTCLLTATQPGPT